MMEWACRKAMPRATSHSTASMAARLGGLSLSQGRSRNQRFWIAVCTCPHMHVAPLSLTWTCMALWPSACERAVFHCKAAWRAHVLQAINTDFSLNKGPSSPHLQRAVAAVLHDQPQALAVVTARNASRAAHAPVCKHLGPRVPVASPPLRRACLQDKHEQGSVTDGSP